MVVLLDPASSIISTGSIVRTEMVRPQRVSHAGADDLVGAAVLAGHPPVVAFMGHADISTTMIYVHHVPRHDAAERLALIVSQNVSRTPQNSEQPELARAAP